MKVRIAPEARADLDAIWLHIAEDSGSEAIASRVAEALVSRFALFARYPSLGRPMDSKRIRDLRVFSVDRYLIFYRPTPDELRILRVLHTSRDIETILEESELR